MTTLSSWVERPRVLYLALGWTLCILVLSGLPGRDLPQVDLFQADKIVHVIMYAMLCFLWARSFQLGKAKNLMLAVLLSSAFGMGMEWMQETFFVDRTFDWMDVLANEIGVLSVPLLFRNRI